MEKNEKAQKPEPKTIDPMKFDDVLTELSLNLDKTFLMTLDVFDYFSMNKPTESDLMRIRGEFSNIATKLLIAIDFLTQSRNFIAEQQDDTVQNIVG